MSEKTIWESLSRIGRRRTVQRTLEGAATGFLIGGLVAVVAVGIRLLGFAPHWPLVALFESLSEIYGVHFAVAHASSREFAREHVHGFYADAVEAHCFFECR